MPVKKTSRSAKAAPKGAKKTSSPTKSSAPRARAKKASARTPAPKPQGTSRRPVAAAQPKTPPSPREDRAQLTTFEKAIQLFHQQKFREAREWFEKAKDGPSKQIAANAELHMRMCDRRLGVPAPSPKSAEECYTYAIALTNSRQFDEARRHLEAALKMEPGADHVHYALAVCHGLSGNVEGAYDSLKRAIELQPRNRLAARQDSDLEEVSRHPSIRYLLYPES